MHIDYSINPLQWIATEDGWIDPSLAPTVDHQFEVIAGAGFERVQPAVPADMSVADYRSALDRHGLTAGAGYFVTRLPFEPLEMSTAERKAVIEGSRTAARQLAEVGSALTFLGLGMTRDSGRVLQAGGGRYFDQRRLELVRDVVEEVAAAMIDEAGLVVALHPHAGTWIETEEETRYILESTDESVLGFGPDIGHLYWAGADPRKLISDFGSRLQGIHLKDYSKDLADKARNEGWSYQKTVLAGVWREPGTGSENLSEILSAIPSDWTGEVVLEVDRGAVETPELSIQMCGEWMKNNRTISAA